MVCPSLGSMFENQTFNTKVLFKKKVMTCGWREVQVLKDLKRPFFYSVIHHDHDHAQ